MTLVSTLEQGWYHGGPLPWWARPLAALYRMLNAVRRRFYRLGLLRSKRLLVPVIVIGNLSVGGTGKTPLTIAVAEALRRYGYHPGVVSRGYGGTQREPLLLGDAPDPGQVGDEPCLIRASGVLVAVGRDRPAAAQLLLAAGCDVVIADDGLQHYRLARDVEICVIDGVRRFGNGRMLPAGPLREPLARLDQVDFRVCNGDGAQAGEIAMRLRGDRVSSLFEEHLQPLSSFAGQRVHAVAAIGNPSRFFESLRTQNIEVVEHAFPDHHMFSLGDLIFNEDLPVLMTSKDAVKCRQFAQPHWWQVPVGAELPDRFIEELLERIAQVGDATEGNRP